MKTIEDQWHELSTTPGRKARDEIVKMIFLLHELSPAEWTDERVDSLMDRFQIEQDIESNDPVSLDDAISRTRQDVHSLFCDMTSDEMKTRLFSPISEGTSENMTPTTFHRPSPKQLESQWLSRWINPTDDTKRDFKEWGKVIGFAGEYLVPFIFLNILTHRSSASSKRLFPTLVSNRIGQVRFGNTPSQRFLNSVMLTRFQILLITMGREEWLHF